MFLHLGDDEEDGEHQVGPGVVPANGRVAVNKGEEPGVAGALRISQAREEGSSGFCAREETLPRRPAATV